MGKKKIILCDTDVFIDYFHEEERIIKEFDYLTFERLALTPIAIGEIYFGMRKRETDKTKAIIGKFGIFHIDKEASKMFLQLMLGYKEKGLKVPDGLIAAIAIVNNIELFTLNRKDYDFIEELKLYSPKY